VRPGPEPRTVINATWDDVPHLTDDEKADMLARIPPYLRDARTKGIPQLGTGIIYPVPESEIAEDAFDIPAFWPRGYVMDVGWNRTAAAWFTHDRERDILHLYDAYYRGEAEPSVHAGAILGRGKWMPGRIDPASRGRSQVDGRQLLQMYRDLGLRLEPAPNAVEAGISETWERLSSGRLRVFARCAAWFQEFRFYRRDEKGKVVKQNDHLMDTTKMAVLSGTAWLEVEPPKDPPPKPYRPILFDERRRNEGWMR
jgi:hypothetical protein